MFSKMYILKGNKSLYESLFKNNTWTWDDMTSLIFTNSKGKLVQIFGAKGLYSDLLKNNIEGIADQSGRSLGYFKFVRYSNRIEKCSSYYVFK